VVHCLCRILDNRILRLFQEAENKAALLLYLCGLVLGLAFSANQAEARGFTVALYIEVATSLMGPWLLVHFFLVLPRSGPGFITIHECIFISSGSDNAGTFPFHWLS